MADGGGMDQQARSVGTSVPSASLESWEAVTAESDPAGVPSHHIPIYEASLDGILFVPDGKKPHHYRVGIPTRLRNNLLMAVGFLELANAGDFAANVWNQVPPPKYAVALMVVGGTGALSIIYFAIRDALLSWHNVRGLGAERRYLETERAQQQHDRPMVASIDCLLGINYRELGTEAVDRVSMDILLSVGALLVGVGTFMAIGGADRAVFDASNLMSGYIGNAPCAMFSLVNLLWSCYIYLRARRHSAAASTELEQHPEVRRMLERRKLSVQVHAILNGVTGAVAGAASVLTSTRWWAYIILAPCIIITILVNWLWRHRVGYERPIVHQVTYFNKDDLVSELRHIQTCQGLLCSAEPASRVLLADSTSLVCVIDFIAAYQLFEDFCDRVLRDEALVVALFADDNGPKKISVQTFSPVENNRIEVEVESKLVSIGVRLIDDLAPRALMYQASYLLEALGCFMCNKLEAGHELREKPDGEKISARQV